MLSQLLLGARLWPVMAPPRLPASLRVVADVLDGLDVLVRPAIFWVLLLAELQHRLQRFVRLLAPVCRVEPQDDVPVEAVDDLVRLQLLLQGSDSLAVPRLLGALPVQTRHDRARDLRRHPVLLAALRREELLRRAVAGLASGGPPNLGVMDMPDGLVSVVPVDDKDTLLVWAAVDAARKEALLQLWLARLHRSSAKVDLAREEGHHSFTGWAEVAAVGR
mmetsp:Transcript_1090/g.3331  ORF Transcript_1090/g.3331 Transcript_1090/m.3331 type:complete len:220 (+) Transcript_1090:212-871(+)